MSTCLCGPDILVLIDKGVDAVVLKLLDDATRDIEVCLVVLSSNRLHASPMDTYYNGWLCKVNKKAG